MCQLLTDYQAAKVETAVSPERVSYISRLLAAFSPSRQPLQTQPKPLSTAPARKLVPNTSLEKTENSNHTHLTSRELEILSLVAQGYTNPEIGQRMVLAAGTIKKHLDNIFRKLAVSSRTEAVIQTRQAGLLN
jgi:ATP/maltotriose-dependent transcriptional regulator MalT